MGLFQQFLHQLIGSIVFQLGYLRWIIVLHGHVQTAILQGTQFRGCGRVPIRENGQGIVANQKGGNKLLLVLRFERQNGVPKLLREGFQVMAGPDELQIGQKEVLLGHAEHKSKQYSR